MIGNEKTIEIPVKEFMRLVKLEARVESFEKKLNREYKNACMIKKGCRRSPEKDIRGELEIGGGK